MALTVANLINIWDNASTSASSSWMSPNSDWDEEVNTPDLTPLLQEVMDYGWRDSVLMLVGNATEFTDEDQTTKVYDSYDGSWSQAPLLTVSYCTTTTTTGAFGRNPEQAVTCSFNNGKCQWFTPSGLKAWSLGSGPTLSSDTGPETGADGGHGWNRMKTGRAAFEKTLSIRLVQEKETKTCDYFIHSCLARRLSVFQFLSQTVLLCRFAVCICWSERERKPAVRAAKPRLLCNLFLAYDFFCVYLRRGHCKYEAWVSHIKLFLLDDLVDAHPSTIFWLLVAGAREYTPRRRGIAICGWDRIGIHGWHGPWWNLAERSVWLRLGHLYPTQRQGGPFRLH